MSTSLMGGFGERKLIKKPAPASSRKGCMRGKGGPENALCTYKGVRQRTWINGWLKSANPTVALVFGSELSIPLMAYDAAARKLYGPEAKLNLPGLCPSPRYPPPSTNSQVRATIGNQTTGSSNSPTIIRSNDVQPVHNNDSVMSLPHDNLDSQGNLTENNGQNEDGIDGFWENMCVNLPVLDESIWAEASISLDFQVMDDAGSFAGTLWMQLAGMSWNPIGADVSIGGNVKRHIHRVHYAYTSHSYRVHI